MLLDKIKEQDVEEKKDEDSKDKETEKVEILTYILMFH